MFLKTDKNEIPENHIRVSTRIHGTAERLRLTFQQDSLHIYIQIIDDDKGVTLTTATFNRNALNSPLSITKCAKMLVQIIVKKAYDAGITEVVFDSGCQFSHGRDLVALLKYFARKAGLKF